MLPKLRREFGLTDVTDSRLTVAVAFGDGATSVGNVDITGDVVDYERLTIVSTDGGPNTSAMGTVTLRESLATIKTVELSVGGIEESRVASLVLNPSLLQTDVLDVLEGGSVTFHLVGTSRVTDSTVGLPGNYSAVDAVDAFLEGELIADFDFIPAAGSHDFILLSTSSSTALDDYLMSPGDFKVMDLHVGFSVDFFGVDEIGGVDVVRLSISGVPEPSLGLAALVVLTLAVRRGHR